MAYYLWFGGLKRVWSFVIKCSFLTLNCCRRRSKSFAAKVKRQLSRCQTKAIKMYEKWCCSRKYKDMEISEADVFSGIVYVNWTTGRQCKPQWRRYSYDTGESRNSRNRLEGDKTQDDAGLEEYNSNNISNSDVGHSTEAEPPVEHAFSSVAAVHHRPKKSKKQDDLQSLLRRCIQQREERARQRAEERKVSESDKTKNDPLYNFFVSMYQSTANLKYNT